VALFLRVSFAAASKAVDRLARGLYLQRNQGKTDRREIILSLTDQSEPLLAHYENARLQKLAGIFGLAASTELRHIATLLDCLSSRIAIENSCAEPGRLCLQCGTAFRESCFLKTQLGRECFHLRGGAAGKSLTR
jgi:hypothetical protein